RARPPPAPAGGAPRGPPRRQLAPRPAGRAAELRPLSALPAAACQRARSPGGRGTLRHQAFPRSRQRREPPRADVPPVRTDAVPAPARVLHLLREGRV